MNYSILIIDDDQALATALAELLSYEGYNTRIAGSGLDGLRQIQAQAPDVVVCDWQMPNLNGNDLLRELRQSKHTAHIPFIIITGHADLEPDFEGAFMLTKPVLMYTLVNTIKQATDLIKIGC